MSEGGPATSPAALGAAQPTPQLDHEMLVELMRLHAYALLRMPWVQTLLVLGLWLFLRAYVAPATFLAWGLLTIGIESLRALRARYVLRRGNAIQPRREQAGFMALAALAGAGFACGAVLFLPRMPLLDQALFGAILFAIPAAGVAVSQSSRYILGAYAISMLFPGALAWARLHPSQAVPLLSLTGLYCAVLILVAADGEQLLRRSVIIRHERDRLVRDLQQRNADVQLAVQQAQRSAQSRARVLATASHDLRQPLNALSVYSAVLAANPNPSMLREVSQNVDQIVRSLGSLLNGLLDLSRLSSGHIELEQRTVALDRLLGELCAEFEQPARQKGLRLRRELQPVQLVCDPVALGRIARNLIDNAIKYTDSGEVCVRTGTAAGPDGACAVLSVSDTGKGIPAAEHERIFEEFYQLDNPGRDRSRGVGLGLAIVRRLIELMNARVEVASESGRGTSFRVSFPHPVTQPGEAGGELAGETPIAFQGRRVYVVDDEIDILKSTRTLLGIWNLSVSTADSVRAVEELFEREGPPDLMLVDQRLRGEERGAVLARRLQAARGPFPVIIVTGETATEALSEAQASGFKVLRKPVAPELLRRAIAEALIGLAPLTIRQ